ncbi:MAG: hypothetical protein POH28_01380 [Acidocella sp.]|nr:hypothetical protein [Acidocella sp.]
MADQSDVETALAAIVANALYPQGAGAPCQIEAVCRVYRGYPSATSLDADLAAGVVNVTVAAKATALRNVTRYARRWEAVTPVAAGLVVVADGTTIQVSGICVSGQLVGVLIDGAMFSYAVQGNDTAPTVASNVAVMLRAAGWIVTYAGSSVDIPAATMLVARVVAGAGTLLELRRQVQVFDVSLWCPDPVTRDAGSRMIDGVIAGINFMPLADGSWGRVIFFNSAATDQAADATLYRRVLSYEVEYPTTIAQTMPAMLFGTMVMTVDEQRDQPINF